MEQSSHMAKRDQEKHTLWKALNKDQETSVSPRGVLMNFLKK